MPADSAAVSKTSLLIVDDDQELCTMLRTYLEAEGFAVATAHDGQQGLDALRAARYAAVVLDITMPVLDGFECLRQLRTFSTVPVLMLTARGDELDRIVGLEIGADDYLPKPFNPRELLARLRAVLRRSRAATPSQRYEIGDLVLEPGAQLARVADKPLELTATEFGVLEQLVVAAGSLVTKAHLSEQVLGRRLQPFDRSIDTHIAHLRKKLGPGPGDLPRIKTVRGQGYLFVRDS